MTRPTQWLYRVLALDDDGDPLDFGVVSAATQAEAYANVAQHLSNLGVGEAGVVEVRFYPVCGVDQRGIVQTADHHDVCLALPDPSVSL